MSAKIWLMVGLARDCSAMPAAAQQTNHSRDDTRGRVATTTDGDAGLWWLPVADTNGKKKHRGSVQRNSFNTPQGQMNVANFTANVSYGLTDRLDVFAGWDFISASTVTTSELFNTDPDRGGVDPRAPFANERWTGNKIGDLRVGAKYAILSEGEGDSFSFAAAPPSTCRPAMPTLALARADCRRLSAASSASGSTATSCSPASLATTSARTRTTPSSSHVPELPALGRRRRHHAERSLADSRRDLGRHVAARQHLARRHVRRRRRHREPGRERRSIAPARLQRGVTWFATNGFFVGGELRWDTPRPERVNASEDSNGDFVDYHVRIGWSPRRAPPPPPPVERRRRRHRRRRARHELTVKAACDPCTVEVGKVSTVSVDRQPRRSPAS